MIRILTILLCVLSVLIIPAAGDYRDPSYSANFAENHITINGFLDDWAGLPVFNATLFSDKAASRPALFNNEVTFSARWDAHFLYLAFFVKDRRLNANSKSDLDNVRQDDAVEIFIDALADGGARMNDNDYQLVAGLNNNTNEYKGYSAMSAKVPRIATRYLKYQLYVRPLGTINDNRDLDSGYTVEVAIELKSLGIDPRVNKGVRLEVGNIDLDTNDFSNNATWAGPAYSEFMLNDKDFTRSPDKWAVMAFNEPPRKDAQTLDTAIPVSRSGVSLWQLLLFVLFAGCVVVVIIYYRRIRRVHEEMRNQVLARLKQYIGEHFKEKIALEDFCRFYNYPESRVQKIFKKHYRAGFPTVILQKRLEEARRMLETTDKNVTEVCFEVGFNDASYFTKTFKSYFNILPKDVKRNAPKAG